MAFKLKKGDVLGIPMSYGTKYETIFRFTKYHIDSFDKNQEKHGIACGYQSHPHAHVFKALRSGHYTLNGKQIA